MRFETTIRAKWMFDGCTTISDMINRCLDQANELQEMRKAGVELAYEVSDDYGTLTTEDPKVAKTFGMHETEDEDDE